MNPNSTSHTAYQVRLLAVLALINFVNFADRQVIVPLVPLLRDQLGVTDAQLGSLQTWLLVVLAVASIPFGFFADRFSQTRIIARGVVFWSLATIVSGLAPSFSILLVARALVGVGEAAYAPAAQSMISGAFPQERRARAQALFAAGMLLGGASGLALGGIMGESSGWQHVFFLVGWVGLVPGLSVLKLKEPPRAPLWDVLPIGRLLRVPAFLAMIAAGMFITFSSVSLLAWSIDFAVNYKEFSLRQASYELAAIALFSLVFGVLTGGYIADRLQKRFAYGRLIAIAGAFLLAAPFVLLAIQSDTKWVVLTRSEEHTSELQSQSNLVCRLLLEKKKKQYVSAPFTAYHNFRDNSELRLCFDPGRAVYAPRSRPVIRPLQPPRTRPTSLSPWYGCL